MDACGHELSVSGCFAASFVLGAETPTQGATTPGVRYSQGFVGVSDPKTRQQPIRYHTLLLPLRVGAGTSRGDGGRKHRGNPTVVLLFTRVWIHLDCSSGQARPSGSVASNISLLPNQINVAPTAGTLFRQVTRSLHDSTSFVILLPTIVAARLARKQAPKPEPQRTSPRTRWRSSLRAQLTLWLDLAERTRVQACFPASLCKRSGKTRAGLSEARFRVLVRNGPSRFEGQ